MNTEQVIGFIAGATCIFALMLFAWFLMWEGDAEEHVQAVQQSINRQEKIWNRAGGRVSLDYDELIASGFPFYMEIRLLRPNFSAVVDGRRIRIHGPYLSFIPEDDDKWQYRLEFLPDFTVSLGNEEYYVHLYHIPELLVHAPPNHLARTINTSEYGVQLPSKWLVGIEHGQKTRKVRFQYTPTEEPLWRYVPKDIRSPLRWFKALLREAVG